MDPIILLVKVSVYISVGHLDEARRLIRTECPLGPKPEVKKMPRVGLVSPSHVQIDNGNELPEDNYTRTGVFVRDGFINRYTGERLIYPGALMLISHVIPDVFPYDGGWESEKGHQLYWDYFATIDHILSKKQGGKNTWSNLVSTSQNTNTSKSDCTPSERGLILYPRGDVTWWDGLMGWFVGYMDTHPDLKKNERLWRWYPQAIAMLNNTPDFPEHP